MDIRLLPREVTVLILSFCDYATEIAFTLTCQQFQSFRISKHFHMQDLLIIELWPCYNRAGTVEDIERKQPIDGGDFFACCYCLRIRSAIKFSNAMMKARRGKLSEDLGRHLEARSKRFCIDCGIKHGRYIEGQIFEYGGYSSGRTERDVGGGQGVICQRCGSFDRLITEYQQELRLCRACFWPEF